MAATKKRATYQDVIDAPDDVVAEIIDGVLHTSPRPAGFANRAGAVLFQGLFQRFDGGGPRGGGWLIMFEHEIRIEEQVLVPDISGWRRERLPCVEDDPAITIVPDWVCEVLSPSTEKYDRTSKLAIYARLGVPHVWLLHPRLATLEAMRLHEGRWLSLGVFSDDERVRVEPFEDLELDLATLWADLGRRVNEPAVRYG